MKHQQLAEAMQALAATPGVHACALVDARSGLVWHACGDTSANDPLWAAAIDYWRLHGRLHDHFEVLGPLGAAVMYHRKGVLAILPCTPELMLVCRAAQGQVDWHDWQQRVRAMARHIEAP